MTHEGRMAEGEANYKAGILLDNADTIYFLENSKQDKPDKPKKSKKKGVAMEEEEE